MEKQYITITVRLEKAEYDILQAIAKDTCNSKSGVIRWLINRTKEEGSHDGTGNQQTE